MSHGLDAKQWPVGRAEKLLPVVGWPQNSSILCSHQPGGVDLGILECFQPPPSSCPKSKTHHLSTENISAWLTGS